MDEFIRTTIVGFNSGILYIPFVIGFSLIYINLKDIDVSIDGVIVLSSIASAWVWNELENSLLSIIGGIVAGAFCSGIVALFQTLLSVQPLMAGLVFSLIAHALSIIIIGESITLQGTDLVSGLNDQSISHPVWHWFLLMGCWLVPIFFYKTHIGLSIRKLGSKRAANLKYSQVALKLSAYALTGAIYGAGAAVYSHSRGQATAGSTFEFLVYSLTAYLIFSKWLPPIFDSIRNTLFTFSKIVSKKFNEEINDIGNLIHMVLSLQTLMAPLGALFLEQVITHIIGRGNQYWKLLLAIALLIAVASLPKNLLPKSRDKKTKEKRTDESIGIFGADFSYKLEKGKRDIFDKLDVSFSKGLSILIGSNGSGKSTLLKLISGELRVNSGTIFENNQDITEIPEHKRSTFILKQNPMDILVPELTAQENMYLAWGAKKSLSLEKNPLNRMLAVLKHQKIEVFASETDDLWDRSTDSLSGGQACCIAVYCAALSNCRLILADEPTTGLDNKNYAMVRNVLSHFADDEDRTTIIVSHDDRMRDITWQRFFIEDKKIKSKLEWWNAGYNDTFFSSVYSEGDYSIEGYLGHEKLDIYQRTQRELDFLQSIISGIENKKILDCPCGQGRHAIGLSRLGASVIGVDISDNFIEEARRKSHLDFPPATRPEFLIGDMRKLPDEIADNSIDVCINMFLAFGFFDDEEENKNVLREFFRILKPGGYLIIHTDINPEQVDAGTYQDKCVPRRNLITGNILEIEESICEETKRLDGVWKIFNQKEELLRQQQYSIRIYSNEEFASLIQDVGFDSPKIKYIDNSHQDIMYLITKPN